jgi:PAS domain S-box-containing protein
MTGATYAERSGMTIEASRNMTLEALSRYRLTALHHATTLFNDDGTFRLDAPLAGTNDVAGLVVSALEALKVAEAELRAQNAALVAERSAVDERTRYYKELFLQSPAPILVTDIFGTICDANIAAGRLFRRQPEFLVRKPVVAMVPTDRREEFRRQFSHLLPQDGPRDWPLTVVRQGDVPVNVRATVSLVSGLGPTSSGVLYWLFATT